MQTSIRERLEDLVKIFESTRWSRWPELTGQKTVDTLANVLECDMVFIHLLDISGDHMIKYASHSDHISLNMEDTPVSMTTGRMFHMMNSHQPIIMDFEHPDPSDIIPDSANIFKSAISVPLLSGDDTLGMFTMVNREQHYSSPEDIEYLKKIGRILGTSVQQAQTARKAADLDILMERKRLCGELHDNLSQLISSLNLGAEAALLSCQENDNNQLLEDLKMIRNTSQEAVQALREEMLSLRTPTNESGGLIPGVRELLMRFKQRWGIETDLHVDQDLEPLMVSSQLELQFMRILHESLSNVLRHANANHVSVTMLGNNNRLSMRIHDNGRGFLTDQVSCERLGLRIMLERAETLGGELTIVSNPGSGTEIRVDVPRYA